MNGHTHARKILSENRGKLQALAEALLEFEALDGEQIEKILSSRPVV